MLPSQHISGSWCLTCSGALQPVKAQSKSPQEPEPTPNPSLACTDTKELCTEAQRGQLSFGWVVVSILSTPALLCLLHCVQEVWAKQPFRRGRSKPSLPFFRSASSSSGLQDSPLLKLKLQLSAGKHFQFLDPREENYKMRDSGYPKLE